ncbi:MAG: PqqD family protein [Candidatus Sulfotelmatobacter sp.]
METISLRNPELVEDFGSSQFEQVFVRSKAVVSRRVAGETLIVPVRGKVGDLASIYSFNQTGSLIWQALESPKSASELISIVEQEYAVSREQAEQDVKQFLSDMQSVDLVQVREEVSLAAMNSTVQGEMQSSRSH